MARVEFYGAVVYILDGVKETDISGSTLGQVLKMIEDRYQALAGTFIKNERLSSLYFIYIDGRDTRLGAGLEEPVEKDSKIRIMNALTGG